MMSTSPLLKEFASQSDKLFNLGVLRSDSFTGDIGEFIARKFYNLSLVNKSTKEIDAIDNANLTYQIKSSTGSSIRLKITLKILNKILIHFLKVIQEIFSIY